MANPSGRAGRPDGMPPSPDAINGLADLAGGGGLGCVSTRVADA